MKSHKRSLRRWKTFSKRNSRARKFADAGLFKYGIDKHGHWVKNTTKVAQVEYIKENQYSMLEDPAICSCSMCSTKHNRSDKRKMRNEERKAIREFYRED